MGIFCCRAVKIPHTDYNTTFPYICRPNKKLQQKTNNSLFFVIILLLKSAYTCRYFYVNMQYYIALNLAQAMSLNYKSTENLMVFVNKHNVHLISLSHSCTNSCLCIFVTIVAMFAVEIGHKISDTQEKPMYKQKLARTLAHIKAIGK